MIGFTLTTLAILALAYACERADDWIAASRRIARRLRWPV